MILLITVLSPETARVAIDTEALLPSGERVEVTKFIVMPHARMVCTVQGDPVLMEFLFSLFCLSHRSWDVDQAIQEAPRALAGFVLRMRAGGQQGGYRLHLAGYSPARGRMAAHVWEGDIDQDEFDGREIGETGHGYLIAPWKGDLPMVPRDRAQFVALAEQQVRLLHEAGTAGGGRLLLIKLEPERIFLETIHVFDGVPSSPY